MAGNPAVGPASPRKAQKTAAKPKKRSTKARPSSEDEVDPREARRQRLNNAGAEGADAAAAAALTFNAHPDGHIFNQPLDEDAPGAGTGRGASKGKGKATAASKEPKTREYIPRQNSGAYAILLSLYKNASFDERQTWITKGQVIEDGQEYSSTPFESGTANRGGQIQGGAGFTYSAWGGMKTRESWFPFQPERRRLTR